MSEPAPTPQPEPQPEVAQHPEKTDAEINEQISRITGKLMIRANIIPELKPDRDSALNTDTLNIVLAEAEDKDLQPHLSVARKDGDKVTIGKKIDAENKLRVTTRGRTNEPHGAMQVDGTINQLSRRQTIHAAASMLGEARSHVAKREIAKGEQLEKFLKARF
jgi:hypothetical protein